MSIDEEQASLSGFVKKINEIKDLSAFSVCVAVDMK